MLEGSEDYEVRCFARTTSPVERLEGFDLVYGDAGDQESRVRALSGMDTFVHIAGIQYAPRGISAMRSTGVDRLVVVSSTSAHSACEFRSGPRRRMEVWSDRAGSHGPSYGPP